ncbi:MAG: site-specific DNA-methyltransferase, partial [Myxococcales bacterium]|nr:site-specific DNA-methyltransferase [Myxococcales bacterium]
MTTYRYDPHLDPALQLGDGVAAAEVERILERGLSATSIEDAKRALRALRDRRGPALAWAGKDERARFEVPSVSLHVHERVDPPTIIEALRSRASSPAPQPALFGTAPAPAPALPLEAYRHGRWRNRLIAGDSLVVMSSLLEREGMQGRVQMVYFDPPYGIGYGSNFQPFVHARDVKERDADLTHEPETLRAFRDTWELGVHSYLSYLRDRARLAWELLRPTGSLFLQIGEANLHLARQVLSEVFGEDNFCSLVSFRKKTMPLGSRFFEPVCDYLLWYARDRARVTSRPLFTRQRVEGNKLYRWVELPGGARRRMTPDEVRSHALLPRGARPYRLVSMLPAQYRENQDFVFELDGRRYPPPKGSCWKTTREGMRRLAAARRLQPAGDGLQYVLFADDYPVSRVTALWSDATGPSEKRHVVQTNERVVARCLLAATDPGDLVLDPTCGS